MSRTCRTYGKLEFHTVFGGKIWKVDVTWET